MNRLVPTPRTIIGELVGKRRRAEVDMVSHLRAVFLGEWSSYKDGGRGIFPPCDVPVYIQVFRLFQKTDRNNSGRGQISEALLGWTTVVSCFTHDVKVYIRIGLLDKSVRIFIEDSDGRELVATYFREPESDASKDI